MKKRSCTLAAPIAASLLAMGLTAEAQVLSWDNSGEAAYATNGWQAGDNGGTNFGAWGFAYSGSDGTAAAMTIGDSTDLDPAVDINTSNTAFRLCGLDAYAHAWRNFSEPLSVTDTVTNMFTMKFAAGVAANNKGLDLRAYGTNGEGSFPSLLNLASRSTDTAGTWYVVTQDSKVYFTDGPHPNTWFDVEVVQVSDTPGTEQGQYVITRHGQFNESITGKYFGVIGNAKVYGNNEGNLDTDAIYFNDFKVQQYHGPAIAVPPPPPTEDYANDPTYADGWTGSDNGGRAFAAWTIDYQGGVTEIADSTALGPDINTDGVSFKIWNGSGGYIQCLRKLIDELEVGSEFSLSFASNGNGANKGFNIQTIGASTGSAAYLLHMRLSDPIPRINDNIQDHFFSDPASANSQYDATFVQVGTNSFTWEMVRSGDYSETLSGTATGRIGSFKFYGKMTGTTDPEGAIFFNSLKLFTPPEGDPNLRFLDWNVAGDEAELVFASQFEVLYTIQGSTDLTAPGGGWMNLSTNIVGTPPINSNSVPATAADMAYRVIKQD